MKSERVKRALELLGVKEGQTEVSEQKASDPPTAKPKPELQALQSPVEDPKPPVLRPFEQKEPEPVSSPPKQEKGACQSVQYSETGLVSCGSDGWLCDRCRGAGDGLKTVYFWSDRLGAYLDLTLPEKDIYDYQKVMEARSHREEKVKE